MVRDVEHARGRDVEALRPELEAVLHGDEAQRDTDEIVDAAEGAVDHDVDAELAPGLANVAAPAREAHRLAARPHPELGHDAEEVDEILGDGLHEVLVFLGGEVDERQHRDRPPLPPPPARRRGHGDGGRGRDRRQRARPGQVRAAQRCSRWRAISLRTIAAAASGRSGR